MRVIKNVESTSIGKNRTKNDDGIYIGANFAMVVDGVSSKSAIMIDGKKVRIADIIIEAIKKIDSKDAPSYAKELTLNEFLPIINMYIKKFADEHGISLEEQKLEATSAIYSKYHNQLWMIGDCRAVYDGNIIENELKADDLYAEIRYEVIKALLAQGYTKEDIFKNDVSHAIIDNPKICSKFIKDEEEANKIQEFIKEKMYKALLDAGFKEEQIEQEDLLKKFYKPRALQDYAKNNPNAKEYGYSVFNGIYTPIENCIVKDLPQNVKSIRLSTDGFPIEILQNSNDLGMAIRRNRDLAKSDPICINENYGIHNSDIQDRQGHFAFDDESAVEIRIEEKNILEER